MLCDSRRMEMVINELQKWGHFTADELIARYRAIMTGNTLSSYAEMLATRLDADHKHRTAQAYRAAVARLRSFMDGRNITLDQMSASLMTDFQNSLKAEGCGMNTVSFYMRMLRAVYNKGVAEGRTPRRAENIFGNVYTGIATTRKLALTADDLTRISALDPTDPENAGRRKFKEMPEHLAPAVAMFLFCYHARGMCFVDMAHLKKSDVQDDTIVYYRHKTGQRIELSMLPVMRRIIEWFAAPTTGSEYVFPVLNDPSRDISLQYESGLRLQNKRLKGVAVFCRIKTRFSSHSARHSWATVAKGAGLPLAVISEGLGHSNQKTTEIYLASLERSVMDKASRLVSEAIMVPTGKTKEKKKTQKAGATKPRG